MLKFRTTKEVPTSLQNEDTNLLEFQFKYLRTEAGMRITVDAYAVLDDDSVSLIGGNGSDKTYTLEELAPLIIGAKAITPVVDDPLEYFDSLVASGAKIVIVSQGYWKSQLTMEDFG